MQIRSRYKYLCWSEYIDGIVNNFEIGWKKLSKYTLYLIFLNMYQLFGMAAPHMILRVLKRYNYVPLELLLV